MKTHVIIILSFLIYSSAYSQDIEIISKTDSIPTIKEKGLAFISNKTDLDEFYFIAKIKITSSNFNSILSKLQKTSLQFNANAFKFIDKKASKNSTEVTFDLYAATTDLVAENLKNLEKNVIYFFGNDNKSQKFKIDKQKIELQPNDIYRFEIPKNKLTKINKGGFAGMTVYKNWQENQPVIFYAFGSGNISPYGDGGSFIGLQVSTGKIMELKSDFAYLIMELMK